MVTDLHARMSWRWLSLLTILRNSHLAISDFLSHLLTPRAITDARLLPTRPTFSNGPPISGSLSQLEWTLSAVCHLKRIGLGSSGLESDRNYLEAALSFEDPRPYLGSMSLQQA